MSQPDEVDRANELVEQNLEIQMQKQKSERESLPPVSGYCFNCGAATNGRFCDAECSDDWEARRRAFKRAYGKC